MAITRTPMVDDDGSGTTGTIINNAWKQEFYGQIDGLVGTWVDMPYAAGNFTATDGATWNVQPGNIAVHRYAIVAQTMRVHLSVAASEVLGTPALLVLALPAGYSIAASFLSPIIVNDAATGNIAAYLFGNPPENHVSLKKLSGANWLATSAGAGTDVFVTVAFEVRP